MSFTVTVNYFAQFRDRIGKSSEEFELEEPRNLSEFLDELTERYPDVAEDVAHAAIAVNYETVNPEETRLEPNDEIAILPPFGGGRE